MKILLVGDSFGVPKSTDTYPSWITRLSNLHEITNLSECGISEYRIFKKIVSSDIESFDKILILHTSPYRVYVESNPVHAQSQYHKNCDVIMSDLVGRKDTFSVACQQYFKYIWDRQHALDMHNLLCAEIDRLTMNKSTLHITNFDYQDCYQFRNTLINFKSLWDTHKGTVAHYDQQGNTEIFNWLCCHLSESQTNN